MRVSSSEGAAQDRSVRGFHLMGLECSGKTGLLFQGSVPRTGIRLQLLTFSDPRPTQDILHPLLSAEAKPPCSVSYFPNTRPSDKPERVHPAAELRAQRREEVRLCGGLRPLEPGLQGDEAWWGWLAGPSGSSLPGYNRWRN